MLCALGSLALSAATITHTLELLNQKPLPPRTHPCPDAARPHTTSPLKHSRERSDRTDANYSPSFSHLPLRKRPVSSSQGSASGRLDHTSGPLGRLLPDRAAGLRP